MFKYMSREHKGHKDLFQETSIGSPKPPTQIPGIFWQVTGKAQRDIMGDSTIAGKN